MYLILTILGLLFLFLDILKTSAIKLTFATTFLFGAIIAYKYSNNLNLIILSLVGFFGIFYISINKRKEKEQKENLKEYKLKDFIGKKAKVVKDIGKTISIDGIGFIEFNKDLWQAKSIDDKEIKAGNTVEIVSKENKIMNVKAINNAKE